MDDNNQNGRIVTVTVADVLTIMGIVLWGISLVLPAVLTGKSMLGLECFGLSFISFFSLLFCLGIGSNAHWAGCFGQLANFFALISLLLALAPAEFARSTMTFVSLPLSACLIVLLWLPMAGMTGGVVYVVQFLPGYFLWILSLFLIGLAGEWRVISSARQKPSS